MTFASCDPILNRLTICQFRMVSFLWLWNFAKVRFHLCMLHTCNLQTLGEAVLRAALLRLGSLLWGDRLGHHWECGDGDDQEYEILHDDWPSICDHMQWSSDSRLVDKNAVGNLINPLSYYCSDNKWPDKSHEHRMSMMTNIRKINELTLGTSFISISVILHFQQYITAKIFI